MAKLTPEETETAVRIFHSFSRLALVSRGEVARKLHVSRETIRTSERRIAAKIARHLSATQTS